MTSFLLSRTCLCIAVAAIIVASAAPSPARAQNQEMQWTATADTRQAILIFGVPETDNQRFQAVCKAREPNAKIVATFAYDTGPTRAGAAILHVAAGDYADEIAIGALTAGRADEGIVGVSVSLATDDGFWSALAAGSSLLYAIPGGDVESLSLRGSGDAVRTFISRCRG